MTSNNGYFRAETTSGGGFDESGQPVKVTSVPGEAILCHIQIVTYNKQGVNQDGKFINSSYVVFTNLNKTLDMERIELFRNDKTLGKFTVQSLEHLATVGRTKIIV